VLDLDQIVTWAEEHHKRTGCWPGTKTSGIIPGTSGEKWKNFGASGQGLEYAATMVPKQTDKHAQ
jgi:hypothetical protein